MKAPVDLGCQSSGLGVSKSRAGSDHPNGLSDGIRTVGGQSDASASSRLLLPMLRRTGQWQVTTRAILERGGSPDLPRLEMEIHFGKQPD